MAQEKDARETIVSNRVLECLRDVARIAANFVRTGAIDHRNQHRTIVICVAVLGQLVGQVWRYFMSSFPCARHVQQCRRKTRYAGRFAEKDSFDEHSYLRHLRLSCE